MIVKIGLDGQAYVDGAAVTRGELSRLVAELKSKDGVLTYYREAPETDGTDAAAETFKLILDLKPRVRLGRDTPSEWGTLTWMEMEEAPQVARFFVARGEKFLISMPPEASRPKPQVLVGGPMSPETETGTLADIDLLLRCDRVLETPPNRAELAMEDEGQKLPSLHFRIAYDRGRWASWYPREEIPPHIESFRTDLWRLAGRFAEALKQGGLRKLDADEASRIFK